MLAHSDPIPTAQPAPGIPANSGELVTVFAHYYRAEIARMAGWRDRIDRTTNWAITVVAAMLSVSLSNPAAHHGVLIFAMVVVLLLLQIEARRYRFFDVYRNRVRQIERNYLAQVFQPGSEPSGQWTSRLADDLRRPRFLVNHRQAVSRRLRRNYGWLFLILLVAWIVKIGAAGIEGRPSVTAAEWSRNAAFGPLPGWAVIAGVAAFYAWLGLSCLQRRALEGEFAYGDVHV